jgi:hypothetical protein
MFLTTNKNILQKADGSLINGLNRIMEGQVAIVHEPLLIL